MHRSTKLAAVAVVACCVLVSAAACTREQPEPTKTTTLLPTPAPTATATVDVPAPVHPSGTPTSIARGLDAPWSIVRLPSGSVLIDERDSGTVLEQLPGGGKIRTVGVVPGVAHSGEGGLLGLAVHGQSSPRFLYAYLTTDDDNRVVRMPLSGAPGSYAIGAPQSIITGIPKATIHNGGRIAFGPDGMLYITTGDASDGDNAQNPDSLGGKILRLKPNGAVPDDNPFAGSPVYSLGHRNPQGIAWDSRGTLWASEFGQNTWDELNIITPGSNYGWPEVEGIGHNPDYVDPAFAWRTQDASPSGLAIVDDTIFMAGLGGQRLWVIYPTNGGPPVRAVSYYDQQFGRLRDVVAGLGPDTTLWMLTNNTDGRGTPRDGDDRILSVTLAPGAG